MVLSVNDRIVALCLAEVVINSLFFQGNKHYPQIEDRLIVFLSSKEPALSVFPFSRFNVIVKGDPASESKLSALCAEEQAVSSLATKIQSDTEVALCCWELARQIANPEYCHWKEEDFTFDCLVKLNLRPMYDCYQEPDIVDN